MNKNRKLVFKKVTLRELTASQASAAVGGVETETCYPSTIPWGCETYSCGGTCPCHNTSPVCDSHNCDTYVGCPE